MCHWGHLAVSSAVSQRTVSDSNLGHRDTKKQQPPFGCHGNSDPIMQQAVENGLWRRVREQLAEPADPKGISFTIM